MTETARIAGLFNAYYDGECWIGVNFIQAIDGLSAEQAGVRKGEGFNSIWQLVNHIIYWRETVMIRMNGTIGNPPMTDFYQPPTSTETKWKETLQHFKQVNDSLVKAIQDFPSDQLDNPSPKNDQSYYQLLTGCLQHDAYHLGQIGTLRKELLMRGDHSP